MNNINSDEWLKNIEVILREERLRTLKRWALEKCEACGEPLVTLFNSEGRDPIRICIKCENEANERDYYGDDHEKKDQ